MRVVFVGAGNLATRLSLEMRKSGMSIGQVYSHTSEHAKILADELGCGWTVVPEDIVEDADLYVFSLKDAVLQDVIARVKPNNGLWVHTAGSMPISVFEGLTARYGVVYPLQTFSKSREVDFKKIPFFLEANSSEDEKVLGEVLPKLHREHPDLFSKAPAYLGVQTLDYENRAVVIRVAGETHEENIYKAQRLLNRTLFMAFEEEGLSCPVHRVELDRE